MVLAVLASEVPELAQAAGSPEPSAGAAGPEASRTWQVLELQAQEEEWMGRQGRLAWALAEQARRVFPTWPVPERQAQAPGVWRELREPAGWGR